MKTIKLTMSIQEDADYPLTIVQEVKILKNDELPVLDYLGTNMAKKLVEEFIEKMKWEIDDSFLKKV